MADPFLAEIRLMSFNFAPKGWAWCNGQLLPINQNQALFALLGTTFGGNGQTNFALPDLRGRVPVHAGGSHSLGEPGGEMAHSLNSGELPSHTHPFYASSSAGDTPDPTGAGLAPAAGQPRFRGADHLATLDATSVVTVGGSQAHDNMQPYLTISFCIALQGIFPSTN